MWLRVNARNHMAVLFRPPFNRGQFTVFSTIEAFSRVTNPRLLITQAFSAA
jgi:hypothetical protein